MLHELLANYLDTVESTIRSLADVYVERYEEEILAPDRVNLRIRIRFLPGCLLEINEAIVIEAGVPTHLGYRYHLQDEHRILLFRYDNTPHFSGLSTFPHHKHLQDQVIATEQPELGAVIQEARQLVERQRGNHHRQVHH